MGCCFKCLRISSDCLQFLIACLSNIYLSWYDRDTQEKKKVACLFFFHKIFTSDTLHQDAELACLSCLLTFRVGRQYALLGFLQSFQHGCRFPDLNTRCNRRHKRNEYLCQPYLSKRLHLSKPIYIARLFILHLAVNGRVWACFCCACDTCLGYVYLAAHFHVHGLKKWPLMSSRRGCLQSPV